MQTVLSKHNIQASDSMKAAADGIDWGKCLIVLIHVVVLYVSLFCFRNFEDFFVLFSFCCKKEFETFSISTFLFVMFNLFQFVFTDKNNVSILQWHEMKYCHNTLALEIVYTQFRIRSIWNDLSFSVVVTFITRTKVDIPEVGSRA